MRSFTTLGMEYVHHFLGYDGEAQYLHGHHGRLTIEVEGEVSVKDGFVTPCNGIKHMAWDYLQNFDHALTLQREDPILSELLKMHKTQGIHNGAPANTTVGSAFDIELARAHPECRLVVV